jgi:hypothetical protein
MRPWLHHNGPKAHVHWNLDCSVGKGGQNSVACDVAYIQWYYALAAKHPETPPERRAVYAKVPVNGICTGVEADPLVQAILLHQKTLKHPTTDGKISVATGDGRVHGNAFFILRLNARLSHMFPNAWPRLDLMPHCPALVADAVRECVPNVITPV